MVGLCLLCSIALADYTFMTADVTLEFFFLFFFFSGLIFEIVDLDIRNLGRAFFLYHDHAEL